MELHYNKIKAKKTALIILHGLYGTADNWLTIAKDWSQHFTVYLVDLRNHGRSPHCEKMDYNVMSDDIIELMDKEKISKAIILGHSMGGKVAMHVAMKQPTRLNALIVVDIAPKNYQYDVDGNVKRHLQIIKGMQSLDLSEIKKRNDVNELLKDSIPEERTRQFIMKNLKRNKNGFQWKLNIDVISKELKAILEGFSDSEHLKPIQGFPVLFVKGAKSQYIQDHDLDTISRLFPSYELEEIENTGHWIHTEQPEALKEMVLDFLS